MYCGIDPGKKGGIALIKDGKIIGTSPMLVNYEINQYLLEASNMAQNGTIYVIEKVGSMPGQGVASMFKFGFNTGYLYGCLHTLKQKVVEVSPLQWKKHFGIPGKKKDPIECKTKTIQAVCQRYPEMSTAKYDSGIFDAILIATYHIETP
ncbi:MAG TPA: hypothetical protein PLW18_02675 [Candidatus Dojkabacteria bacterium]|nr:hypothetical protein [Candidatus Dojkabacteria bacterium]